MGGKLSKKRQRERGRQRWREQQEYLSVLNTGLNYIQALAAVGRGSSWLYTCFKYDPVFAERVAITDLLNRGVDRGYHRGIALRKSPQAPAHVPGQTARQSQKAYEELVDLRQKAAFIAMYRDGKTRTEAAHDLNLSVIEVAYAMKLDREFAAEIENVQLSKLWNAEDAMYDRAKDSGVDARFLMKRLTEQIESKAPPKRKAGTGGQGPSWGNG